MQFSIVLLNERGVIILGVLICLLVQSPLSVALSTTSTIAINPAISLNPDSGLPGTVVTVTGTGFSANVTVSFSSSSVTISGSSVKASPSGAFTAQVTVQGGQTGSIVATGNDSAANPKDTATATFAVENLVASNTSTVTIGPDGQFTVDDTTKDGVYVQGLGLLGVTGLLTISTASESAPPSGVTAQSSGSVYSDVRVQFPPTTSPSSGSNANVCITNPSISSGWSLQYWTGSSWASASGTTVTGTKICGQIAMSALTGTPVAAVPSGGGIPEFPHASWAAVVVTVLVLASYLLVRRTPSTKELNA